MKKIYMPPKQFLYARLLPLLLMGISGNALAQVKVGDNPTSITPNTMLDIESSSKGFLKPRLTTAQRTSIASPAIGLEVYDIDTKSSWNYNGTAWVENSGNNFYNSNGTLTGNRTVTQGASSLGFTATGTNGFTVDGSTFTVDAANNAVGIGTASPNTNAAIDATAVNKGILLPRVSLSATDNASPLSTFVAGMTVYNTASNGSGSTGVTPGIYYSDGTKWVPTGKNYVEDAAIGSIAAFASNTLPTGYLACDGAAVSRSTYSALFALIGTTYGSGDGSTTFNLPDLRGEFIRGWDNGRGADAGRGFASSQGNTTANGNTPFSTNSVSHTHTMDPPNAGSTTNGSHTHGITRRSNSDENSFDTGNGRAGESSAMTTDRGVVGSFQTYAGGNHSHGYDIGTFNSGTAGAHTHTVTGGGDSETRPRNVAMIYAIKAVDNVPVPTATAAAITASAMANEPWYKTGTTTGATSNTDNVFISGNVGMGTNTPAARVHVKSPTPILGMWESGAGTSNSKTLGIIDNGYAGGFKLSARNNDYSLKKDVLMMDLPTGNVAIGTPFVTNYTLTIGGDNTGGRQAGTVWVNPESTGVEGGQIFLAKDQTYGNRFWSIDQHGGNGTATSKPRFRITDYITERFTILENGNVGISNKNPLYVLDVNGKAATNNEFEINSSDGNNGGSIRTTGEATTANGLIIENRRGAGKIIFNTNNGSLLAERMRITNAGYVGIGTSTPASTLTVGKEDGSVSGEMLLNPTNTASEGGQITLMTDVTYGSRNWVIDQYGGDGTVSNPARLRIFGTGSPLESVAITENGNVSIAGSGTNVATTPLQVGGAVRVGTSTQTAVAAGTGAIRYNGGLLEYSNGSSWQPFSVSDAWISVGAMVYSTTAGSLTVGTVNKNQVRYRKTGDDTEVFWEFSCAAGGSGVAGSYLFTLPAGLTFNLSRYPAYTALTGQSDVPNAAQIIAMGSSIIPSSGQYLHEISGTVYETKFYIVPYSATQFRILAYTGSNMLFMTTSHWAISNSSKPYLTARFNTGNP